MPTASRIAPQHWNQGRQHHRHPHTIHISIDDTAVTGHDCPGIRIHGIDMSAAGHGIPSIADGRAPDDRHRRAGGEEQRQHAEGCSPEGRSETMRREISLKSVVVIVFLPRSKKAR